MQDFAQRMKQIKEALDAAEKQVGTHVGLGLALRNMGPAHGKGRWLNRRTDSSSDGRGLIRS